MGKCPKSQTFCTQFHSVSVEQDSRLQGPWVHLFRWAGLLIFGFFILLVPGLQGADRSRANTLFQGNKGAGVIVAVSGPMSGPFAARYRAVLTGVRRAVSGNGPAWPIQIVSFDDKCSAQGGREAALQVVASGAVAVIGHPCASSARAAFDIYGRAKLIYFATGAELAVEALLLQKPAPFVFQMVRPTSKSGEATALVLAALAKGKGIALVHDRTGYSRRVTRAIKAALKKQGHGAACVIALDDGQPSMNSVVSKIFQCGSGAVHFAGFENEARILIAHLDKADVTLAFMGTETLVTNSFLEFVEKRFSLEVKPSVHGSLHVGGAQEIHQPITIGLSVPFTQGSLRVFSSSSRAPSIKAILPGNNLEARAFSAAQVFMEGVDRAASVRADLVDRALRVGKFQTRVGEVSFSKNGLADLEPFLYAIFDGERWGAFEVHATD